MVLSPDQVWALGKDLCLSPLAVKDKVNCQPSWVIVDHTWFGVNDHTMVELPLEVMQFGGALCCIFLWLLWHAEPSEGLVNVVKYNISNVFYWMPLDPKDTLKLSILMPCYNGELPLVVVPLSLMMGWVSSPPTFCTASKTVADLANASLLF